MAKWGISINMEQTWSKKPTSVFSPQELALKLKRRRSLPGTYSFHRSSLFMHVIWWLQDRTIRCFIGTSIDVSCCGRNLNRSIRAFILRAHPFRLGTSLLPPPNTMRSIKRELRPTLHPPLLKSGKWHIWATTLSTRNRSRKLLFRDMWKQVQKNTFSELESILQCFGISFLRPSSKLFGPVARSIVLETLFANGF